MANKKTTLSFTAVAVGSTLLIVLLGAAVLMGTLLYQFLNGRNIVYPDSPANATCDLVIRSDAGEAIAEGGAEEAARAFLPCTVTVKIGAQSGLGVVVTSDGWILISSALAGEEARCTVTLSDGTDHLGTVEGPVGYGLSAVSITASNLRAASFGSTEDFSIGMPLYKVAFVDGQPVLFDGILAGRLPGTADGTSVLSVAADIPSSGEDFILLFDRDARLAGVGLCDLSVPSDAVSAAVPAELAADAVDALRVGN